jgi:hypothetical protein
VVPVHSGTGSTLDFDFDRYANEIKSIRSRFSQVVVTVHGSCVEKGYWTEAFDRVGVPWIVGASYDDMNSLCRIRHLFSTFQFVTANGFGSHIAYASAFGAAVSIWGSCPHVKVGNMSGDTFFRNAPTIMQRILELESEGSIRTYFPEFFTEPWLAETRVEWGRREIGWENRRSPAELKRIFGWDLRTRVIRGVAGRVKKLFR